MTRLLALFGVVALAGCASAEDESPFNDVPAGDTITDEMPEDLPAGECEDHGGTDGPCDDADAESSGGAAASPAAGDAEAAPCGSTGDCTGAGVCGASYQIGERGEFVCRFACIPTLDATMWCRDDGSCCDPEATCSTRGYCVVMDLPEDESDDGGGPQYSDQMPEDLPAGGNEPTEDLNTTED